MISVSVRLLLALGMAIALAPAASAQVRDTTRRDSTLADTTDMSEAFLKAKLEGRLRVPVLPFFGSRGLLPALSRVVFDRDSIEWHNAETVGDLLTKVPGVYLWRGGWIGSPERGSFQGRGASSVEYVVDGVPYLALGPDSVGVDASLFPLSFVERMEIERLPGLLRVYLYTRRHDRLTPRTRVAVASGDFDIARYQGLLERRGRGGFGLVAAMDHLAVPLSQDQQGAYRNTQAWLQLSYVPSRRFAASLQAFRSGPERDDVFVEPGVQDTVSAGLRGRRTDLHASVTYMPDSSGLGSAFTFALSRSAWTEDSTALSLPGTGHSHVRLVDQSLLQVGGIARVRSRASSLEASAWYRSRWTPFEARGFAATSALSGATGSVEAVYRKHDGGRTSQWLAGRAGLELPLRLRATGLVRVGSVVQSPMIESDVAVDLTDVAALLSLDRRRLGFEVGYWRTSGTQPQGFSLYRQVPTLGPAAATSWVTLSARIAPRQWLILDGWYSDAVGAGVEGQPPTHSVINGTIQSKFLRTFRSGIFTLKLQGTMETWGTGFIGRDPEGTPVILPGATFVRGLIQFQIASFTAYFDRVNLRASRLGYVPGLPVLRLPSTFGVRWEFSN